MLSILGHHLPFAFAAIPADDKPIAEAHDAPIMLRTALDRVVGVEWLAARDARAARAARDKPAAMDWEALSVRPRPFVAEEICQPDADHPRPFKPIQPMDRRSVEEENGEAQRIARKLNTGSS